MENDSIFATGVLVAYPAAFAAFIVATFFVGRLRNMVWGSGAQQFSTESRKVQVAMGMPKVWSEPWGHGIGQGASTLGFTNQAGAVTIDTYYLAVALEFGVIGFLVYYGIFVAAIWKGIQAISNSTDKDTLLLVPLMIALINFMVIKSIFSQQENHPLIFALLGATVALVYRTRQTALAKTL